MVASMIGESLESNSLSEKDSLSFEKQDESEGRCKVLFRKVMKKCLDKIMAAGRWAEMQNVWSSWGNLELSTDLINVKSFKADVSSVNPLSERIPVILTHRRSTTVSLETYPLYSYGHHNRPARSIRSRFRYEASNKSLPVW